MGDSRSPAARQLQVLLDRVTPYPGPRWAALGGLVCLYALRVYSLNGWFIVTYALAIFVLNLFIGFISPQMDADADGPVLPVKGAGGDGEFKPFSRKVNEMRFWQSSVAAVCAAFAATFFELFNVPVFWPILLVYFATLLVVTLRKQIAHMIKHRYIPCSFGKPSYGKGGGGGGGGGGNGRQLAGAAAMFKGSN